MGVRGLGADEPQAQHTVRPRLSGPLLSVSLCIRKKIAGDRCTAYVVHPT